jgi:hypothetical protein
MFLFNQRSGGNPPKSGCALTACATGQQCIPDQPKLFYWLRKCAKRGAEVNNRRVSMSRIFTLAAFVLATSSSFALAGGPAAVAAESIIIAPAAAASSAGGLGTAAIVGGILLLALAAGLGGDSSSTTTTTTGSPGI